MKSKTIKRGGMQLNPANKQKNVDKNVYNYKKKQTRANMLKYFGKSSRNINALSHTFKFFNMMYNNKNTNNTLKNKLEKIYAEALKHNTSNNTMSKRPSASFTKGNMVSNNNNLRFSV